MTEEPGKRWRHIIQYSAYYNFIYNCNDHNRNMHKDINNRRNSRVIDNTKKTVTSLTLLTEQNTCL